METTKPSVSTDERFVKMNETKTTHRRRHHPRITTIMPLTNEQRAQMQWLLDFCNMLEMSGCEVSSAVYADSLVPKSWYNADPQCARHWSGSAPVATPYEPWSGDYSDVEPAERREDWIGL